MRFLPALLAAAAALVAPARAYDEFPEEELEEPGMSRWVTPADVPTPVYPPGSITTFGVTDPSDFNLTVDYLNAVTLSNPVPQEIKEIVRGLGSDSSLRAKRIFEYVRNRYDFQPYFGLMKGAEKAHLDRAGNDADLCSLLAVMLTEAGYAPQFVEGWMTIPAEDLAKWTKTDQTLPYNDVGDPDWGSNVQTVLTPFGQGGIYYNPAAEWVGDKIAFKVHRTLVRVEIGGTTHLLDPAFKAYRRIEGSLAPSALKTAMGYDQTALLSALGGTSVAHNGVENMDEADMRSLLSDHAGDLVTNFLTQQRGKTLAEIIGGHELIPVETFTLASAPPYAFTQLGSPFSSFPAHRKHYLRAKFGTGIDKVFATCDIACKRLYFTFGSVSPNRARLWVDETEVDQEPSTGGGINARILISVDHPITMPATSTISIPRKGSIIAGCRR